MKHPATTIVVALLLGLSVAGAATGMSDTCHDDASGTLSGTWVSKQLFICEIIDDTGTISASTFIPAPLNAQLTTSTTSAPGVLDSYSMSNWAAKPATATIFTVDVTAYGQTGAQGYTEVIITVGGSKPVVVVGYGSVEGILNQTFNVPAGTPISITVLSKVNGSGYVNVSS
jgi:hypothetical protein